MRLPDRILLRYFNLNMVEYFRLAICSLGGLTLKNENLVRVDQFAGPAFLRECQLLQQIYSFM